MTENQSHGIWASRVSSSNAQSYAQLDVDSVRLIFYLSALNYTPLTCSKIFWRLCRI